MSEPVKRLTQPGAASGSRANVRRLDGLIGVAAAPAAAPKGRVRSDVCSFKGLRSADGLPPVTSLWTAIAGSDGGGRAKQTPGTAELLGGPSESGARSDLPAPGVRGGI